MDDAYMGTIVLFAGNFAPRDWMFCDGSLLDVTDYQALFSILGTFYGGDGQNKFALPDLRGRVPVGTGTGPGLNSCLLGDKAGVEKVSLSIKQMPAHTHTASGTVKASYVPPSGGASYNNPKGKNLSASADTEIYSKNDANYSMAAGNVDVEIANAGAGQEHNNMQPYLGLNYIIAVNGLYPPRP